MRFAYADPPYPGCGHFYAEKHGVNHRVLIGTLCAEYPDGWALSTNTPSLREVLPLCPPNVRVMAWVKPFASFKPGVGLAYAWEPVILFGGRRRERERGTVRDWFACSITLRRGFTGAKPEALCFWLFEALGCVPGDTLDDLFPGSGAVSSAWRAWNAQGRLPLRASS